MAQTLDVGTCDPACTGSSRWLGLAVVAEIVSAQRGSVRIGDSAQGGCQVVVTLAASPVTPAEEF